VVSAAARTPPSVAIMINYSELFLCRMDVFPSLCVSCLQDGDADELCPEFTMLWASYKKNAEWLESMGDWYMVVTEGGICLYCSRVYINKFSGKTVAKMKQDMSSNKELSEEFLKFRLWVIMATF
jgi:hypothetical protein